MWGSLALTGWHPAKHSTSFDTCTETTKKCQQSKGDVKEQWAGEEPDWERAELGVGRSCALQQHCHFLGHLCPRHRATENPQAKEKVREA